MWIEDCFIADKGLVGKGAVNSGTDKSGAANKGAANKDAASRRGRIREAANKGMTAVKAMRNRPADLQRLANGDRFLIGIVLCLVHFPTAFAFF